MEKPTLDTCDHITNRLLRSQDWKMDLEESGKASAPWPWPLPSMLFFILDLTTTSQCLSLVILIEKPSATWLHLVKREVRKTPKILSLLPSMLLLFCSIANCVQQCVTPQTASGQAPRPSLSPEFSQIYVHWGTDAIQPLHPLLPISFANISPLS